MSDPSDPARVPPVPPPAPMGPVTTQFARLDPGPSQVFGLIGALVIGLGAVLVVLAFTIFDWFKGPSDTTRFGDLHRLLSHAGGLAEGPAKAYFGWLGWGLLTLAVLTALIAATPAVGGPFRIITPVLALATIVVTFIAIRLFTASAVLGSSVDYATYLKNTRLGFYLAVAGFLLIGFGAALGPRPGRS